MPTICTYGMIHVEVTPVTSKNGEDDTPQLFELSPNSVSETIVEITVDENEKIPKILTKSKDTVSFYFN